MSIDVAAAAVARFRTLLAERLGWAFADNDVPKVARVLRRRAEDHDMSDFAYLQQFAAGATAPELAALAVELTITETYFFRHGEQFRALADRALPARIRDRAGPPELRMLSVGCSSGEEAYTLAIVGLQTRPDPRWRVTVLGLDANPVMLRRAEKGRYSDWSLRETPDATRRRWFRPGDGNFELSTELRDAVEFRHYNVVDEDTALWQAEQYDVIFCRNLLMYLTRAAAQALVRRITQALTPGGYLFLGHTDTLGSRPEGLEALQSHGTFYYRRPSTVAAETAVPGHHPHSTPPGERPTPAPEESAVVSKAGRDPAYRERAVILLREERFAEELTVIEAGLAARPESPDLLLHGVLLAQVGRIDDAEIVARRLLDVAILNADAHHLLGVCLEGAAAVDAAIEHYQLAAYLDPEFAMPKLRLGLLARRNGSVEAAGAELDVALTLLHTEREERIMLFGGGFGRVALATLCRAELDATGANT
jgi:chemotaxis protein methyltransferase CheR